jgi:O-antigen/teichoic acid export membrane protein
MFLRHSVMYLLARGLPGLINLAAIMVYTRLLAPAEYGRYALVIAGVGLANKLLFEWLRLALLRFRPAYEDREQAFQASILAGFAALVLASAVAGGIVLVASGPGARQLLAVGLALLWVQALFELELEQARSRLQPRRYGLMSLARAGLSLAIAVVLVRHGLGALGPLLGLIIAMLIALARPLARTLRALDPRALDAALLRRLGRYGAPLAATAALGFVIASSDRFMLGWLMSEAAVGRYAAGYDLTSFAIGLVTMVVNLAAYPLIIQAHESGGAAAAGEPIALNLAALLAVGLPATLLFVLFADNLAAVVLDPAFAPAAAAIMPAIALAALIGALKAYYFDLVYQLGQRTIIQLWVVLIAAAVNILLNLWWIPLLGLAGAAYASLAGYLLALVLSWLWGRRILTLPAPSRDALKVALAAALLLPLLWPLRELFGLTALLVQAAALGLVFVLLLLLLNVAGIRAHLPLRAATRKGE